MDGYGLLILLYKGVPVLPMISLPDAVSRLMVVDVFRRVSIYSLNFYTWVAGLEYY